jgi:hypothetical protein
MATTTPVRFHRPSVSAGKNAAAASKAAVRAKASLAISIAFAAPPNMKIDGRLTVFFYDEIVISHGTSGDARQGNPPNS